MPSVVVVGMGPGDLAYLPPKSLQAIEDCEVLVGGLRMIELFSKTEKIAVGNNLAQIAQYIRENAEVKRICVLAAGDAAFYGILRYLVAAAPDVVFESLPGIGSLPYFCNRLALSYDDMVFASTHGRQTGICQLVARNVLVGLLTDGLQNPGVLCKRLNDAGLGHVQVAVGENLSYPEERIRQGTAAELAGQVFSSLSVMVVRNPSPAIFRSPGLPDDAFVRTEVPMTKQEVRSVALAKLGLTPQDVVYDLGAGTGSVSVECGLLLNGGQVFAFDHNPKAVETIEANCQKLGAVNVQAVLGKVPQCLTGEYPAPDKVFLGGTSGGAAEILERLRQYGKRLRVVANAVTLESAYELLTGMESQGFAEVEIVSVAVARGRAAGGKHLMQALNPVYVISGEWREPHEG